MEEDEYRATYNEIASVRCVFEKALTNNQCKCSLSEHFCLADREGYSCKSSDKASNCIDFLEKMRKSSRFLLKNQNIEEPMPHNMEIRVQAGGIKGLRQVLDLESHKFGTENTENFVKDDVLDIVNLLDQARDTFGSLRELPYSKIVQSVANFKGRKRSKKVNL